MFFNITIMQLSFQKVFFVFGTVFAFIAFLVLAKTVLIPLAFAMLLAFILLPVTRKMEEWGVGKISSAFFSLLALFLLIGGGIFLFSTQIIQLSDNLNEFKDKILEVFANFSLFVNKNIEFVPRLEKGEILDQLKKWLNNSLGTLAGQTFSGTASFLTGLLTAVVFTFLILIYRDGLVRAFVSFYPREKQQKAFNMFQSIQQVGQQYLFGMLMIVLILGILNSLGLWIIGLDNPFLFGFLAAVLAIIPYVGTTLGAAIPVLYSFMTHDSLWMPATIVIFFWAVQVIEGNFLTPKIVGGNLEVNALASILSIIIGASIWGIAGMILFLPFAAMFRVVCEEYEELKPVALLIGDHNYNKDEDKSKTENKGLKRLKEWFS